jgi:hypothetical protein
MTPENDELSEKLKSFVTTCIDSVEQLQVLILLLEDTGKGWRVNEIAQRLRSVDSSITKRLEDLYVRKVIRRNSSDPSEYAFELIQPEFRDVIFELATVFKARPYKIVDLIYERPREAIRAFSETFNFKKGKNK